MHKQDKIALQVLTSLSDSGLTNSDSKLDEDTIAKLNTLHTLCKEQGTKDEEKWFTEIAQAVFEFFEKAPIRLVEAWKEGMNGWARNRDKDSVLIKKLADRLL